MKKIFGGLIALIAVTSISRADTEFQCPKPGTVLTFATSSGSASLTFVEQRGFTCVARFPNGSTSHWYLGIGDADLYSANHLERLLPLKVGNEIEFTRTVDGSRVIGDIPTGGMTFYRQETVKVLRQEKLAKKAGSFDTFVIEHHSMALGKAQGTSVTTYWWAPDLNFLVKRTTEVRLGPPGRDASFEITDVKIP